MLQQIEAFLQGPVGTAVLSVIWALVILLIGYIVARILARVARGILKRISLDNQFAQTLSEPENPREFPVEDSIGKVVFWVVMIFVIVAALDALNLDAISEPLGLFLNSLTTTWLPALLQSFIWLLLA